MPRPPDERRVPGRRASKMISGFGRGVMFSGTSKTPAPPRRASQLEGRRRRSRRSAASHDGAWSSPRIWSLWNGGGRLVFKSVASSTKAVVSGIRRRRRPGLFGGRHQLQCHGLPPANLGSKWPVGQDSAPEFVFVIMFIIPRQPMKPAKSQCSGSSRRLATWPARFTAGCRGARSSEWDIVPLERAGPARHLQPPKR